MLQRAPALLGSSLEDNLRPSIAYLEGLGVNVPKALEKHPQILNLSIESKLKPTVAYLREQGMRQLGAALSSQPSILSLSLSENLRPKLDFLRSIGMEDLGAQLDAYPAILTLSLETNLRPSVEALAEASRLRESMGLGAQKLTPRHVGASLEARILPRLRYCKAHGRAPTLHGLTTAGEAVFCKQSGCSLDEWREWLAKQESIRDGNQKSGGLNIPWLPDSMDLDELLQADDARPKKEASNSNLQAESESSSIRHRSVS